MALLNAAIGIIFNEDKTEVLLVKRKDVPIWVLPGGGIDPGESAEHAVLREVKEETGFDIEIERKCAEYTPINKLSSHTTVFVCHILEGKMEHSSECSAIAFFPLKQFPKLFFGPHKIWINDALIHSYIERPLTEINYVEALKFFLKHPWTALRYFYTRFTQ